MLAAAAAAVEAEAADVDGSRIGRASSGETTGGEVHHLGDETAHPMKTPRQRL